MHTYNYVVYVGPVTYYVATYIVQIENTNLDFCTKIVGKVCTYYFMILSVLFYCDYRTTKVVASNQ